MQDQATSNPPNQSAKKEELEKAEETLRETVRSTHEVLVSVTTVFPLTLFPDTITIDREKLTIVGRFFFNLATVRSIKLEDILDVTAAAGPFFGSIHILSKGVNPEKGFDIKFLRREDALRVKRILQGYAILAAKDDIDLNIIETKELAEMLDKAGKNEAPDIVQG